MHPHSKQITVVYFAALLLLLSPVVLHSQIPADQSDVNVRQADPDRIESYKNDPAFVYDESEPETSLIGMIIREVIQFLDQALGEGTGNTILQVIFFAVMAGVVYLVLNQIMKGKISTAFTGQSASETIHFRQDPAVQKDEDLNRLIESAARDGNYREAVRLLYQKALKELSGAGLIRWTASKTNLDYLYEMDSHSSSASFRRLTRIYEYTEYGDFEIDRDGFNRMRTLYVAMNDHLNGDSDV
ncbi:DUF4129 domain-containing protein [Rhodohalobacter sp. 8-1]|uniref:DUF4129 domain-containing protein n=1 Tax=Rhodohalobacter sp. 8-1 TaxID=3131972 RepID=UPI0030EE2035